ncbi:signal peptidase I [Columbia Basin potato purple top phytoplasma]|uniref:Signal peptidase I n=1 Tax=Columbia Basin potato purple top phytoplasma TaxID=307134 RepID=A0ABT5LC00_9MOLU|nr:signal peptidase I [Columbia Basin potato purple top phytoplasma]MDC9032118.1 signal peptidase I [Columbia Basin potato purple top phytoplasma]
MVMRKNRYKKYFYYFLRIIVFCINCVINISLWCLLIVNLCKIFWEHEKIINTFYFDYYWVISPSMSSLINVNDIVIVKKISLNEKKNLKKGDIVIFHNESVSPKTPIIHRVVENIVSEEKIRTKGDNNRYIDPFRTQYKDIFAKHVNTIPLSKLFGKEWTENSYKKNSFFLICFIYLILKIPFLLKKLFSLTE